MFGEKKKLGGYTFFLQESIRLNVEKLFLQRTL